MAATVWPETIYELDAGLGLTVCVVHQGEHVFYAGACVAFSRGRQPKALRVGLTHQDRPPVVERPGPVQVQLDEAKLAAGIAIALDQLMERRREAARVTQSPEVAAPTPSAPRTSTRAVEL